jgi:hypothetical protein
MLVPWQQPEVIKHTECLIRSYHHWTGRELLSGAYTSSESARQLFEAPFVVVSHGVQADPILNYGNQAALNLWQLKWEELIQLPSRLTAEAPSREERAKLLERVTRDGYISDYSGVRISKSGKRFMIMQATVWNLRSDEGAYCGQAAMFKEWKYIDKLTAPKLKISLQI